MVEEKFQKHITSNKKLYNSFKNPNTMENFWKFDCRHFMGDRPCKPYWIDRSTCDNCHSHYDPVSKRILIIKLDALGDVLRATPLLRALKKQDPKCHISWIVEKSGESILRYNKLIDRLFVFSPENCQILKNMEFDLLLSLDKAPKATSLCNEIKAKEKRGFGLNKFGQPYSLNKGAEYQYGICMDNFGLKTQNNKSFQEMTFEISEIPYNREEYMLDFPEDKTYINNFKKENKITNQKIIGMITGCGPVYPYKKWDTGYFIKLINKLPKTYKIILFGEKDEIELNNRIMSEVKDSSNLLNMANKTDLLQYFNLIKICNLMIAGDTLGMHVAIALKIPIITVFGPTPHQEIDLYDRGIKLIGKVPCLNCYNQIPCIQEAEGKINCMQTITVEEMEESIKKLI